eukprot:559903-Pyramimonas_sp.AAC.1
MHKRRANFWTPKTRRLPLVGIRPGSQQDSPAAARGPEEIAALTAHWRSIFIAKIVQGDALQEYLSEVAPQQAPMHLRIPTEAAL